jgi:hypothetical protein
VRVIGVGTIEIPNGGCGERPAERGHPLFPPPLAYESQTLDVPEVLQVELEVLPERVGGPPMKFAHIEQDADLSVPSDLALDLRHESVVVTSRQPTRDMHFENSAVVLFRHV